MSCISFITHSGGFGSTVIINFTEKIKSIKGLLNTWCYRELTYIGRITVIKTLALPILIQSLTVLPNPPEWVIKEIQDIFSYPSNISKFSIAPCVQ
jgi:hypothetical protein